jgi:hypothetical protein
VCYKNKESRCFYRHGWFEVLFTFTVTIEHSFLACSKVILCFNELPDRLFGYGQTPVLVPQLAKKWPITNFKSQISTASYEAGSSRFYKLLPHFDFTIL